MRDPGRLITFYMELERIHREEVPDWRFGQMMYNIFGKEDIFYLEEDTILKRVKDFFGVA